MPSDVPVPLLPSAEPVPGQPFTAAEQSRQLLWWRALLVLPFALCLTILTITGRAFPCFWDSDEKDAHWPLILEFARTLPAIDWRYQGSASTPLFHLLFGIAVRLVGPHIQWIRALNTVCTVAGVLALFETLRGPLRQFPASAALYCGVVLGSCYFFGPAFRLLTDNLAIVFCILAMQQLFLVVDPASPVFSRRHFFLGCLWVGAAILTRQSYIFLELPFFIVLWQSPLSWRQKALGLGGLALAVAPFAAFVLWWHGMVPPRWQHKHSVALLTPRAPLLVLMLLAFYGAAFDGPEWWERIRARTVSWRAFALPALLAVAGLALVACVPMIRPPVPTEFPTDYFAGVLYRIADPLPQLRGNSILYWALVPAAFVAAFFYLAPLFTPALGASRRLPACFLLALLLSSFLNPVACQKYYDALVLLFLAWQSRGGPEAVRRCRVPFALLLILFIAFYVRLWRLPVNAPHSSPPAAALGA